MGFNTVYKCLLDIFPQVDQRILKAVAIENSKDVDAAAETILTEILPYLTKKSTPSALKGKAPIIPIAAEVSNEAESSHLKEARPSSLLNVEERENVPKNGLAFRFPPFPVMDRDEDVSYPYGVCTPAELEKPDESETSAVPNGSFKSSAWNVMWDSIDWQTSTVKMSHTQKGETESAVVAMTEEHQCVSDADHRSSCTPAELEISAVPNLSVKGSVNNENVDTDGEELILFGKIPEKGAEFGTNENVHVRFDSLNADKDTGNANKFPTSLDQETQQLDSQSENQGISRNNGTGHSLLQVSVVSSDNTVLTHGTCNANGALNNDSQDSDGSVGLDTVNAATQIVSSAALENTADSLKDCLYVQAGSGQLSSSVSETTDGDASADCQSKLDSVNEMNNGDNEPHLDVVDTRSSQVCRIDFLEEIIEDAKTNKKTLFQAMQSVMDLMREVELEEEAAEQAKVEATTGGMNILAKVEDLTLMLTHAKEANDMHAGEVYGEKAILATEVRELRSRLVGISEERDQSLAILDEMRQSLEARQAAADEAKKEAEREKQEKEESALKALAEQEAIMEKVVEESKILQQEAEENSKLREFLMDRGRVVDSLQGEISVICQDVLLLKKNFDERVPLSKSISSSQTSCLLASSSSSLKSIAGEFSSNLLESAKTPEKTSPAPSVGGQSPKSRPDDDQSRVCKEASDDDWDFFE